MQTKHKYNAINNYEQQLVCLTPQQRKAHDLEILAGTEWSPARGRNSIKMRQRLLDPWRECTGSALLGQDHSPSYFSQPLGRGGRGPRLAVYRTVRAGNEEKGLALTPRGAQRQPNTLSRACAQQLVRTVGCERGITTHTLTRRRS